MNARRNNPYHNVNARRRNALLSAALLGALGPVLCAGVAGALSDPDDDCYTVSGTWIITGTVSKKCVDVTSTGTIIITSTGTLILTGGAKSTSTIDGTIELTGTLKITQNNHTLSGQGQIEGQANSARIQVTDNLTLTSSITVRGALEIRAGSGTFQNDGVVKADDATTTGSRDQLTLFTGTFNGCGEYKVDTSGATLQFRSGITATGLAADFTVSNGALDVDENVTTTGDLSFTGGAISVASGKTFQAS